MAAAATGAMINGLADALVGAVIAAPQARLLRSIQ
jgi:hypothetical protein